MDTSTTEATDSGPRDKVQSSKRRKLDTITRTDTTPTDTTIDEAEVASLLAKIETLTREIKDGQRLCRFATKHLPEDEFWEQPRRDLLDAAKQVPDTKFKVVVLGASGVGKSSVLNALLDKGNLLPSSAIGEACTAVPIEIHYNEDAESVNFKAEIQYMKEVEWRSAIAEAKAEIDSEDDEQSDRGQSALQRVSLVYPSLSRFDISTTPVNDIIVTNASMQLLGKCTTLQTSDPADFYREFKQQIGSLKRPGFATWPMIDHVRLYVRHPLLENGLVLVDIPGMFETNQARVENAANYLEKCSAVCIMTPAARSNSDALQTSLVSRAIHQIQFDRRLDSVLFVCTKADDLDLEDALEELDVPEAKPLQRQLKAAQQERERVSSECDTLRLELQDQTKTADNSGKDMGRWKKAMSRAAADWDSFIPPKARLPNGKFLKAEASERIWDEDEVTEKIAGLKQEKTTALSRCVQIRAQLAGKEVRLQNLEVKIEAIGLSTKRAVFETRNNLIKEQQAKRYLDAVKLYEQHSTKAVEGIVELADYMSTQVDDLDNVKAKVFCVSALAYGRLSGLRRVTIKDTEVVRNDENRTNFLDDVEDTEMPALARRLKRAALTERHRNLCKVQIRLQSALKTLQGQLSPSVQKKEIDLEAALQATQDFANSTLQFLQDFGKLPATDDTVKEIYKREFTDQLPELKNRAVARATSRLEPHSRHPGSGGSKALWPAEYKATVHPARNGFYATKRQLKDGTPFVANFNESVATVIKLLTIVPIEKVLVSTRGGIKPTLMEVQHNLENALDKLHSEFRLHAITAGVDLRWIIFVDEQLQLRKQGLQQAFLDTLEAISKAHVAAARPLTEDIQSKLKPAYARAYQLHGTGARVAMSDEVCEALANDDAVGHALNMLDSRISATLNKVLKALSGTLTKMASSIAGDYSGHMEHRGRRIESTGNPKLDQVRNRMIALGYEVLGSAVSGVEEDVPEGVESGVPDQEQVWDEMITEAAQMGDGVIKMEEPSELENGSN